MELSSVFSFFEKIKMEQEWNVKSGEWRFRNLAQSRFMTQMRVSPHPPLTRSPFPRGGRLSCAPLSTLNAPRSVFFPILRSKKQDRSRDPVFCCVVLSASLVIRDALCLRGSGVLGGEGQDHEGDDVGQHVVNTGGDVHSGAVVEEKQILHLYYRKI